MRRTDWQERFLAQFEEHGVTAWAAARVEVGVKTVDRERKRNAEFAEKFDAAFERSTSALERTAMQWAVGGFPIKTTTTREVQQLTAREGQAPSLVVTERTSTTKESIERSVTMLIFMLKSRRPDVYRERLSIEQTGADGGAIEVRVTKEERDAAVGAFGATVTRLADARAARDGAAGGG